MKQEEATSVKGRKGGKKRKEEARRNKEMNEDRRERDDWGYNGR